MIFLDKFKYQF